MYNKKFNYAEARFEDGALYLFKIDNINDTNYHNSKNHILESISKIGRAHV